MHISPLEEYALRCALTLARLERSTPGLPIAASRIAEREGISIEYVSKIFHLFKKAGLVDASRGANGGFRFKVAPEKLTLKTLFQAVDPRTGPSLVTVTTTRGADHAENAGNLANDEFCSQFSGNRPQCLHTGHCSIRPVWQVLTRYVQDLLDSLTLAGLLKDESEVKRRIQNLSERHSEELRATL